MTNPAPPSGGHGQRREFATLRDVAWAVVTATAADGSGSPALAEAATSVVEHYAGDATLLPPAGEPMPDEAEWLGDARTRISALGARVQEALAEGSSLRATMVCLGRRPSTAPGVIVRRLGLMFGDQTGFVVGELAVETSPAGNVSLDPAGSRLIMGHEQPATVKADGVGPAALTLYAGDMPLGVLIIVLRYLERATLMRAQRERQRWDPVTALMPDLFAYEVGDYEHIVAQLVAGFAEAHGLTMHAAGSMLFRITEHRAGAGLIAMPADTTYPDWTEVFTHNGWTLYVTDVTVIQLAGA